MDKEWLRAKVLARGRGAQVELAEALKVEQPTVNKMLSGVRKKISSDEADIIREVVARWEREKNLGPVPGGIMRGDVRLPIDPADMPMTLPELDVREMQEPMRATMSPVPYPTGRPDIPVWASAEAGNDGALVLVNDPIDWIRRSERMQGVQKPFAFNVLGDSMSPAIEHGDQVVVNPSRVPKAGKDHVFLQTLEDGTILALVKRLLRATGTSWKVRQFNPPKDFDLPKSKWSKAFLISEKRVD